MTIDDRIKDEKIQYDINKKAAKISALSSGKIDKYEYLTGEEILPSNQKQKIEQAKSIYSPVGKAFEKQAETAEDKEKNQISTIKESGKQITESNEVGKNDFNIDGGDVLHEQQKEISNRLAKESALEFDDRKSNIYTNNLVYKFSGSENKPIDFKHYQLPLKLFEDLRDCVMNSKEVLKNQARLKSDLSMIKIGGNKSVNHNNTIKNITNFFDLREKIIIFLEIIYFCYLKLSTKQNMEKDLKY